MVVTCIEGIQVALLSAKRALALAEARPDQATPPSLQEESRDNNIIANARPYGVIFVLLYSYTSMYSVQVTWG